MIRMITLTVGLCLVVVSCTGADDAPPTSSRGGQGGAGSGGTGGKGGQGGQRQELCGIIVTCQDGVLSGYYGVTCSPLSGVCPLGCRVPSASALPGMDPHAFAQTLCVQADAGADGTIGVCGDDASEGAPDADPNDGAPSGDCAAGGDTDAGD